MLQTVQIFGATSAESGVLGLNLQAFVVQLITFILALLLLQRFAVKPILKVLHERRETIEKGVKLGEQMQKDKAEQDAKVEEILHDAREQADKIIAESNATARQNIQEAEEVARKKADTILAQADGRIKQDTARARRQLEKDIASLVSEATETIIDEKVDSKKDAALMERALKGNRG